MRAWRREKKKKTFKLLLKPGVAGPDKTKIDKF